MYMKINNKKGFIKQMLNLIPFKTQNRIFGSAILRDSNDQPTFHIFYFHQHNSRIIIVFNGLKYSLYF